MHIWGRKLTRGSRLLLPRARGETAGLAGHFTGVPSDLIGNSQHRPALGPTRQQTVSRHLPSHASPHLCSVLLCASVFQTPSLLGAQTRLVNTEAQR